MLANVPAVILGDRIAGRIPVRVVHGIAAAIFAVLGVAALLGVGEGVRHLSGKHRRRPARIMSGAQGAVDRLAAACVRSQSLFGGG